MKFCFGRCAKPPCCFNRQIPLFSVLCPAPIYSAQNYPQDEIELELFLQHDRSIIAKPPLYKNSFAKVYCIVHRQFPHCCVSLAFVNLSLFNLYNYIYVCPLSKWHELIIHFTRCLHMHTHTLLALLTLLVLWHICNLETLIKWLE